MKEDLQQLEITSITFFSSSWFLFEVQDIRKNYIVFLGARQGVVNFN
jgi:hypothetical protein